MANSGNLYVFLHGLTVSRDRGNDLEIVLPLVPGHVQKAGNWLGETPIVREGFLRLRGVDPPSPAAGSYPPGGSFSRPGPWIFLPGTTLTSRKRAATLLLPRPNEILSLLRATDPNFVVQTMGTTPTDFKEVGSLQVLVYNFRDENELFLEGHYWEPCATGGSITLHIISTSEDPETKEHYNETEDVMHEVVRNYPGLLFKDNPRPLLPPFMHAQDKNFGDLNPPPNSTARRHQQGEFIVDAAGRLVFALAELEPPQTRFARFARLGRSKRGNRPIEGMWQLPDALALTLPDCLNEG